MSLLASMEGNAKATGMTRRVRTGEAATGTGNPADLRTGWSV